MSMMTYRHRIEREAAFAAPLKRPKAKNTKATPVEKAEPEKESTDSKYTKTDINRASTDTLKEIANEIGIDGADDKTGGELKKLIIEKMEL